MMAFSPEVELTYKFEEPVEGEDVPEVVVEDSVDG